MKCSRCGMDVRDWRSDDFRGIGPTCLNCWDEMVKGTAESTQPKYPQYHKRVNGWIIGTDKPAVMDVDVYGIVVAFNVTNPATAHAIKKLLRAGTDHNETLTDLQEAKDALDRAMEIERGKA